MLKYLKFGLFPLFTILIYTTMMQGGMWMWSGLAATVVLICGGDALLPDDRSEHEFHNEWFLNLMLWVQLPNLLAFIVLMAWGASPVDYLGITPWIEANLPFNHAQVYNNTAWYDWIGGALGGGFLLGAGGTNVAHELIHRTYSLRDMIIGRWLLAFTGDASFAIEHVYGHHKNLGTPIDPATARRGENVYGFVWRSTRDSYKSAWRLEKARVEKFGHSVWSPIHSRMMRGNLMTASLVGLTFLVGGWQGAVLFMFMGAMGKALLEIVNYMEHYGICRSPEVKVEPRHSWNSNKWMSTSFLFALPRHSHHHAEADKEYWHLRSYPHAPTMPYGYLTMILMALVPPVFKSRMVPMLNDWDRRFATPQERLLVIEASKNCGMKGLIAAQPNALEELSKPRVTTSPVAKVGTLKTA